jgi:hypothetical protein
MSGWNGGFSLSGKVPPLALGLAASAAIAFARRQKTSIFDWAAVWIHGEKNEHTVDEFIEGLATQGWFVDLERQARALFERKT